MPNGKHAYLILCHSQFRQLRNLLTLLDDERNDIYIHVDKKSGAYPQEELRNAVKKSGLFFTERVSVNWGGYSQIQMELVTLQEAVENRKSSGDGYAYYHLLSGADMPLKTQDEIHRFFEEHAGKEFVHYSEGRSFLPRIERYHPFQEICGRGFRSKTNWKEKIAVAPFACLAKITDAAQCVLPVDRLGKNRESFYWGSNWFSVTHDFAAYVLSQTAFIERYFRSSVCADEIFMQTLLMNSPFRERRAEGNLRLIDWKRGSPYVFRSEDYDLLMSSGCLFARKFDEAIDPDIIEKISRELRRKSAES